MTTDSSSSSDSPSRPTPHRVELDPPSDRRALLPEGPDTAHEDPAVPPEAAAQAHVDDADIQERIAGLVSDTAGADTDNFDRRLVGDMMTAALKLIPDGRHTGELKLMAAAFKELRYAYRVFGPYAHRPKVTIFGSARTPEDHPDYLSAVKYSKLMADAGWMTITGAGDGIMKAGHEGPGRESSFGVAIRLPFETSANEVIKGDEKLINFRYFFTRKLMFLSQCEAVVCFPGGFGTLDEAFETLTLIQTGKAAMVPIVLVEGEHRERGYWNGFDRFVREQLLERGWVSPEDPGLYYLADSPQDAAEHVLNFYRVYHSSRYVRDTLVIRLNRPVPEAFVESLNDEFKSLIKKGKIEQRGALEVEEDALDLPRLTFTHTRYHYGLVRKLIDRINESSEVDAGN
ncbi:MAG: LOG family protein [Planctomycetota bacterium]